MSIKALGMSVAAAVGVWCGGKASWDYHQSQIAWYRTLPIYRDGKEPIPLDNPAIGAAMIFIGIVSCFLITGACIAETYEPSHPRHQYHFERHQTRRDAA
jgi:hypothetical protein